MENQSVGGSFRGRARGVLAVVLWLVMSPASSWATIYYVDTGHPNARDTNPGTPAQPFKTIGKATSLVNAGDTVYIKAGVYRELVILSRSGQASGPLGRTGSSPMPITIAAHPGHEGKVIIDAAEPLLQWRQCIGPQQCGGNLNWSHIQWADVSALAASHPDTNFTVRQVFQHGKLLRRSRYPDTGWSYPTSMPDPMKSFSDSTLSKPAGHFAGAVCHIKTADWQIDQIPIASFSGSTITLSKSPRYAITTRYGYYVTSIVGEIDEEGEWAYDPLQKRIYLWPEGDAADGVEFSYRQYCIRSYWHTAWNVVRGLVLRNAWQDALWLYQSHHMSLEENTIEHPFRYGILVQATEVACDDNQILRNTIRHPASRGIDVDLRSSRTNIEGNFVYATGTDTFGGDLMNGQSFAIYVAGPYTRVYNNRIDKTGYSAIYVSGKTYGRDISCNYVTNAGLALADGGGLYTAGYSDVAEKDHIHHNIFVDSLGCLTMDRNHDNGQPPTVATHSGLMHGIYIDEEGNNRLIEHNTVINCRSRGIFFHWAPSNVVQHNTLYGNRTAQVYFSGKDENRRRLSDISLLDNILFATDAQQKTFSLHMDYDNVRFGQSDRNCFYNPHTTMHMHVQRRSQYSGWLEESMSLNRWCGLSGYDAHSRTFSYLEQGGVSFPWPVTSRIVYNTTLESQTVDLEGKTYCDVQGNKVEGTVTLEPFTSKILIPADYDSEDPDP